MRSACSISSFIYAIYFLKITVVLYGDETAGFPTLDHCHALLGGIQLFSLGIIGGTWGAFSKTARRPTCIASDYNEEISMTVKEGKAVKPVPPYCPVALLTVLCSFTRYSPALCNVEKQYFFIAGMYCPPLLQVARRFFLYLNSLPVMWRINI